ncbi:Histidine kinase-, DNA gyrase B-, and HSP90-like ATPase family protein [Prunus dulcis]|uniref:Histidine kinase-, DNA gyrase B-, and HSP90-like ATPase family protein n=1 Tax=Prunus dulcis TaxID=3755 RepID=A0A4Y1QSI7_PRUDU|nr:Histidine kinase-, DNA gyrase B-, and HSP90-like ATPase family protein [Prunus dulcis]
MDALDGLVLLHDMTNLANPHFDCHHMMITSEEMISLLPEFMDTCENKDIRVEEYLDFIVKKRSVASKEALGIRIHSMGEKGAGQTFQHFSQRVESFSPIHKDFCGKHIRFDPKTSSSEDEGRDDYLSEENDENNDHVTGSQVNFSSESVESSDRFLFIIPFLRCYMRTCRLEKFSMFEGQNNLCRQPCIVSELKFDSVPNIGLHYFYNPAQM